MAASANIRCGGRLVGVVALAKGADQGGGGWPWRWIRVGVEARCGAHVAVAAEGFASREEARGPLQIRSPYAVSAYGH
ncbi:hypothetical protein [Streptomyces sp. TP-A0874]|uniref:hypothetical protein n=1 Tax=Streptomyces sp. TP-A0874 TaxID=549819 RepID=UPI000852B7F6|nr:hypothetical protein [Streptomyces sp. TP-A0874]